MPGICHDMFDQGGVFRVCSGLCLCRNLCVGLKLRTMTHRGNIFRRPNITYIYVHCNETVITPHVVFLCRLSLLFHFVFHVTYQFKNFGTMTRWFYELKFWNWSKTCTFFSLSIFLLILNFWQSTTLNKPWLVTSFSLRNPFPPSTHPNMEPSVHLYCIMKMKSQGTKNLEHCV